MGIVTGEAVALGNRRMNVGLTRSGTDMTLFAQAPSRSLELKSVWLSRMGYSGRHMADTAVSSCRWAMNILGRSNGGMTT